jgi:hypothetical protein
MFLLALMVLGFGRVLNRTRPSPGPGGSSGPCEYISASGLGGPALSHTRLLLVYSLSRLCMPLPALAVPGVDPRRRPCEEPAFHERPAVTRTRPASVSRPLGPPAVGLRLGQCTLALQAAVWAGRLGGGPGHRDWHMPVTRAPCAARRALPATLRPPGRCC